MAGGRNERKKTTSTSDPLYIEILSCVFYSLLRKPHSCGKMFSSVVTGILLFWLKLLRLLYRFSSIANRTFNLDPSLILELDSNPQQYQFFGSDTIVSGRTRCAS